MTQSYFLPSQLGYIERPAPTSEEQIQQTFYTPPQNFNIFGNSNAQAVAQQMAAMNQPAQKQQSSQQPGMAGGLGGSGGSVDIGSMMQALKGANTISGMFGAGEGQGFMANIPGLGTQAGTGAATGTEAAAGASSGFDFSSLLSLIGGSSGAAGAAGTTGAASGTGATGASGAMGGMGGAAGYASAIPMALNIIKGKPEDNDPFSGLNEKYLGGAPDKTTGAGSIVGGAIGAYFGGPYGMMGGAMAGQGVESLLAGWTGW